MLTKNIQSVDQKPWTPAWSKEKTADKIKAAHIQCDQSGIIARKMNPLNMISSWADPKRVILRAQLFWFFVWGSKWSVRCIQSLIFILPITAIKVSNRKRIKAKAMPHSTPNNRSVKMVSEINKVCKFCNQFSSPGWAT